MVVLIYLTFGCTDQAKRQAIREQMVETGVQEFKKMQARKCWEEALVEADRIVDSMMLDHAIYAKIDTFTKPLRPIKPALPPLKNIKDTSAIGPVLQPGEL